MKKILFFLLITGVFVGSLTNGVLAGSKIKQKIKIKIKGDNNIVYASSTLNVGYPSYSNYPSYSSYYYPNYPTYHVPPYQPPYQQNRPPVWQQTGSQTVRVGQYLQFTVNATDPDNDYLVYSAANLPQGAYFNPGTRVFSWIPASNQGGAYNVIFRASDYRNASVEMTVHITVTDDYSHPYPYPYPNPYPYPYPQPQPYPTMCYGQQPVFTSLYPTNKAHEGQYFTFTVHAESYNCPITYRVVNGPTGLTVNTTTGVVSWLPSYSQGGQAYSVIIGASNSYAEATQTHYIFVEDSNPTPPVYPPYEPPVYYPPVTPPAVVEKLAISDVKVQVQTNGDTLVNWTTNIPASSRVIFDVISQAGKTKDFTYANATVEDSQLATAHSVNLGNLEANKTFYLRAVSKVDTRVAISSEISFVKLPCLACQASFIGVMGWGGLFSPMGTFWLLVIIIVLLVIGLMRSHRRPITTS